MANKPFIIAPAEQQRWCSEPIVITGLGVLSCVGLGREAFWDSLEAGRSGIRQITRYDMSDVPCRIAGHLWDYNPEDFVRRRIIKYWTRHVHQAMASTRLAIDDAELEAAGYARERIATCIGTSVGGVDEQYHDHVEAMKQGGYKKVGPMASSKCSVHSAVANVTQEFVFRGPSMTLGSGCATGLDVVAWGVQQIRAGNADAAVVGASETPAYPLAMAAASCLGILSNRNNEPEKAMRPFDADRDGLVLSEGAATIILEKRSYAIARGAPILGEIVGYASTSEGLNSHILDKEGVALARALTQCLADGGLSADELDCVFCHGAALEMYDTCELNAYKAALGEARKRIAFTAVKSLTGQPYSVGGLLNIGAALLAFQRSIIPPTLNLDHPAANCDIDLVSKVARYNDVRTALAVSMSFGGTHSALALRKAA